MSIDFAGVHSVANGPKPTSLGCGGMSVAGDQVTRRLVAWAADVAGYSRLMGGDEEGTLARLKATIKAFVDPAIASHAGRIVKTLVTVCWWNLAAPSMPPAARSKSRTRRRRIAAVAESPFRASHSQRTAGAFGGPVNVEVRRKGGYAWVSSGSPDRNRKRRSRLSNAHYD